MDYLAARKKKKKSGMSPTFKAGLIIIVVIGIIWAFLTVSDPWYETETTGDGESTPISMADENNATSEDENTETETDETKTSGQDATVDVSEPVEDETSDVGEETEEESASNVITPVMSDSFDYGLETGSLSNEGHFWSFKRNTDHTAVVGYSEGVDLAYFDAFFIGDTSQKVVYLTFDEGYENGYTSEILDILAQNDVQAAFFVTDSYVNNVPDLVKRMKDEGHVVGSHSVHHYDGNTGDGTALYDVSDDVVVSEVADVAETMMSLTGYNIDLFFRPPGGLFSERTLYLTRQQGYKSIFWSMAYQDWYVNNQPGKEAAYDHVISNVHPGAIILLHAVSESNTQALDSILKDLKAQGYRFGSLYELPSKYMME